MKSQGAPHSQTIQKKKNKLDGPHFPISKLTTSYKKSKTVWYGHKADIQTNGIEQKAQKQTLAYMVN